MTEARDDIARIRGVLDDLTIRQSYIHSDAALSGGYVAFLEPRPAFDFADGADSISISGHKFLGVPLPCGVVLAKKRNVERIARSIDYIGSLDTTISGSRNGFTPLALWYVIRSLGLEGMRERAHRCLDLAAYAQERLVARGVPAWRNRNAITVVFPKTGDAVKAKWQLATERFSHLIVMPGISRETIDAFVDDVAAEHSKRALQESTR
jgi:histidine decarboxylase